jgi:hypothetical protein
MFCFMVITHELFHLDKRGSVMGNENLTDPLSEITDSAAKMNLENTCTAMIECTKCHCLMVSTPAVPYVVVEWLHSYFIFGRPRVLLSALTTGYPDDRGFLWFSLVSPGKCQHGTLKLGHDRFLPNPFQFVMIHLSSYHQRYTV